MSRTILEVCDRKKSYEEGGRLKKPWWRQMAARKQLSATLKDILEAARELGWKSRRRGRGGGYMGSRGVRIWGRERWV